MENDKIREAFEKELLREAIKSIKNAVQCLACRQIGDLDEIIESSYTFLNDFLSRLEKESILGNDKIRIVEEYRSKGKLVKDFPGYITYDLVQAGYPLPDYGEMVPRYYSSTNGEGNLIPGNGEWCKASVMQSAQEEIERLKKENEGLRCCGNCERFQSGFNPHDGDCVLCIHSPEAYGGIGMRDNWESQHATL